MTTRLQQNLFLVFFGVVYFTCAVPVTYAGIGLDASWQEALILAINKKLIFGREFVFNYGPLGYLNFRLLPEGISPIIIIFLDLFSILNIAVFLKLCFEKADKNWKWVAAFALVIWFPWGFFADISFTFFYFFIFWILYTKQTKNIAGLLLALILSVLIFYIKVNLSLIVYALFYGVLVYFGVRKAFKIKTLVLIFFSQVLLTYALSGLLKVDILAYIGSSIEIINAYQDAMATVILEKNELLSLLVFEALIVLVLVVVILRQIQWFSSQIMLYFFVAIAGFLNFKQAHTAVSHPNIFGFFLFMPPLAALLYVFSPNQTKKIAGYAFVAVLVFQILGTQLLRFYMGGGSLKGYQQTFQMPNLNPIRYFQLAIEHDFEKNFENAPLQLPKSIKDKIGNQTVDFVQNDLAYVFFNKLNYNPRPVIQTYQANSASLADRNGEKYDSKDAPDFVFFKLEPFREQNPFWMDGKVNLALIKRYNVSDTLVIQQDTLLLFQKSKSAKPLNISPFKIDKFELNKDYAIPDNQLVWMNCDIEYSFLGKLCRLFFQPPYLFCEVTYQDGHKENFRAIDKILKGGVLVNRKITTQKELATFYNTQGAGNQKITSVKFWAKYPWGFK